MTGAATPIGAPIMAKLLEEAMQIWAREFDGSGDGGCSISGADLLEWFAQWRLRAKMVPNSLVTP